MKKLKVGSVEVIGYAGILIWAAVILLRGSDFSNNSIYLFCRGILPNLGAAWAATLAAKWFVLWVLKRDMTFNMYMFICIGVFVLALFSEIIHDLFLNSPFDIYDIIITAAAQLFIFLVPVVTKDRYFGSYKE